MNILGISTPTTVTQYREIVNLFLIVAAGDIVVDILFIIRGITSTKCKTGLKTILSYNKNGIHIICDGVTRNLIDGRYPDPPIYIVEF